MVLAIMMSISVNQVRAAATFTQLVIEPSQAPWGKQLADFDGDSFLDIVEGGGFQLGGSIYWYQYPNWTKFQIGSIGGDDDLQVGDINSDGAIDVVVNGGTYWYENPRGTGGNVQGLWTRHTIDASNDGHDLVLGDVNADGKLDVLTRGEFGPTTLYIQGATPDTWTSVSMPNAPNGEASALADINRDGRIDIIGNGYWLQQPATNITSGSLWTRRDFGVWPQSGSAAVADINNDGRLDIFLAASEVGAGTLSWFEAPLDPITGTWIKHDIDNVEDVHRFHLVDMNKDGSLDIAFGEMHQSSTDRVGIYYNSGSGASWTLQVLVATGAHNIAVGDIGNDGDIDILGANWDTNSPGGGSLNIWRNDLNNSLSLDAWLPVQVDNARTHQGSFGLTFGDIDGDNRKDIASGNYWYKNPGGSLTGSWTRTILNTSMTVDAMAVLDVNLDGRQDIIAEAPAGADIGVYWLRQTDGQGTSWTSTLVGTMQADSADFGSQGYRLADIIPGGKPEIVLTSGSAAYYFQIPTDPFTAWNKIAISTEVREEGIDMADIDRDGDLDLAGFLRPAGTTVSWWENPGNGAGNWARHDAGATSGIEGDRLAMADFNSDGRIDMAVTETNLGPSGNALYWFEQPTNPALSWIRHTVASDQGSLNSMDVADMNLDGKTDIITGEHRGTLKVTVWENVNSGSSWIPHAVDQGKESHLGAQVSDLDNDGDKEIVSIAFDAYQFLYLWRNDGNASVPPPPDATPPSISLTVPADGSTVSGIILVSANAADNVGVAGVQFLLDGANLGAEDTASPYSISWNTAVAANGSHVLSARARDAAGNTATSTPVAVTVDNTSPPPPSLPLFIQDDVNIDDSGAVSATIAKAFGSNVTVGDLIVAGIGWGSATTANVSDSQGNSYSPLAMIMDSPNSQSQQVFYAIANATGANTVTASFSSATAYRRLQIAEFGGVATINPLDASLGQFQASPGTAADAVTSGNITTTADNALIYGFTQNTNEANPCAAALNAGTNFSGLEAVGTAPGCSRAEWRVQTAAGNIAATFTLGANTRTITHVAAFKAGAVAPDITSPTVSISAPLAGATVSGNTPVSASAADDVGVLGVQFFLDGLNLGAEDAASPYSIIWDTAAVSNGSHVLSARARDAAGNIATSTPVAVTVDNLPPDITPPLISNVSASAAETTAVVSWTTDELSDSQVEYGLTTAYGNSTALDAALVTVHSQNLANLSPNTLYHFRVKSQDAAGNLAVSADFTFTTLVPPPDTTPPVISDVFASSTVSEAAISWITDEPASSRVEYGLSVAYGTSTPLDTVLVTSHNQSLMNLNSGSLYHYRVISSDAAGNVATSTDFTFTTQTPDTSAPAVAVTSPVASSTVSGIVTVSASASDNIGVIGVQFLLDGANLGAEDTAAPYSISWDTAAVVNGSHVLSARARDAAGNQTTSEGIVVMVNNVSSAISFVQGAGVTNNAMSIYISKAFSATNSAGSLLVAAVSWGNSSAVACSDSQGNVYTVATIRYDSVNNQSLAICYAPNAKAGSNTVRATFGSAVEYRRILIHEYSGIALTNPVDVTASNLANGTTVANGITSTPATTLVNGDLIFGAVMDDDGVTRITPGTGFTQRKWVNNKDLASEDLVQSIAGSIASTWKFGAAHRYLAQMVAFKHQ